MLTPFQGASIFFCLAHHTQDFVPDLVDFYVDDWKICSHSFENCVNGVGVVLFVYFILSMDLMSTKCIERPSDKPPALTSPPNSGPLPWLQTLSFQSPIIFYSYSWQYVKDSSLEDLIVFVSDKTHFIIVIFLPWCPLFPFRGQSHSIQ